VLVRIRPQVQAMLRDGPGVTDPVVFDTGDPVVDAALTELAVTDLAAAGNAEAAFSALTWGQGLRIVRLRSVQEFLWYQLPTKIRRRGRDAPRYRGRPRDPVRPGRTPPVRRPVHRADHPHGPERV
jgi:hypothetical protein